MNDFARRMMEQSEYDSFISIGENGAWNRDPLMSSVRETARTMNYTLGYSCGYIIEQVGIGIVSGGTVKLAQVLAKGGAPMVAQLVKRTGFAVASRFHWMKLSLRDSVRADELIARGVEGGLRDGLIRNAAADVAYVPGELLETALQRSATREIGWKRWFMEHCMAKAGSAQVPGSLGRLRRLVEGGDWAEGMLKLEQQLANAAKKMDDEISEEAMDGLLRLADCMAPLKESGLVDDILRIDDLVKALCPDGTAAQKKLLRETCERAAGKTGEDLLPKAWLPATVKDAFPTMYRYANWYPTPVDGVMKLPARTGADRGWY